MKLPRLVLAAMLAGALAACGAPSPGQGPRPAAAQTAEIDQSRQLLQELRAKNMLVEGDKINDYMDAVTARIDAQRGDGKSTLKTFIIKDADANAFTSGAGYVFFNAGMLAALENEAQFAMVLAHEIAHEDLGHVSAGMAKRQQVGIASAVASIGGALLGVPGDITNLVVGTAGQAYYADFSRDQETAADRLGMRYLAKAGYNGAEGAKSFAVLKKMYGDNASIFAGHPTSSSRQADMQRLAREEGATEGRVAASAYLGKTNPLRKRVVNALEQAGKDGPLLSQMRANLRAAR